MVTFVNFAHQMGSTRPAGLATVSSAAMASFQALRAPTTSRVFRLVNERGEPHPVVDDHFESCDAAWAEALHWWRSQAHASGDPIGIGIEVSTPSGDWRTIRPPCV